MAGPKTKRELECLVDGGIVNRKIDQELTYRDLYKKIDNIWSILFTTGYLTQRGEADGKVYGLAIPNLEIRVIFVEQILEWFQEASPGWDEHNFQVWDCLYTLIKTNYNYKIWKER